MSHTGAVNCLDCNPGDFQNLTGAESCAKCLKDSFTNISGLSLVIHVKLVKKVILEVPNALVVVLVNRVRVIMVLVKHVRKVKLVN